MLALCAVASRAQISHGGYPMADHLEGATTLRSSSSEVVRMPAIDSSAINSTEVAAERSGSTRCRSGRFAYAFPVDYTPENAGSTYRLADGRQVWRLHIISEGAYSLNLIFDQYELDALSQLFLYAPDRSVVLGAFTAENNSSKAILATAPIEGDEVVVELITPPHSTTKLRLGSVNHDYRGLRKLPTAGNAKYCEVDGCQVDGHELEMRSSVLYIIDGTDYCSGNVVNNTKNDGTPYVITSAHCLFDRRDNFIEEKAARSVFFFNFNKPHCFDKVKGTTEMSVAGAEVAFSLVSSDALLLRLSDRPPLDYEVYYAGWNATSQFTPPFYCLHHPNSDMLKISVEEDQVYLGSFDYDNLFLPNKHWVVDNWESGIMEAGSSGSALFDSKGRIIGSLSGGATTESCESPGYDTYWAMSVAWTEGLSEILAPGDGTQRACAGMEANVNPCRRVTNWSEADTIHEMIAYEEYAAGHNKSGLTEYAERFRTGSPQSVLYGIHFIPYQGTNSSNFPLSLRVYRGDETPGEMILEEPLYLTATEYNRTALQMEEKSLTSWAKKENYYRLSHPILVDSTFFVAVKLDDGGQSDFALCHTEELAGRRNTAYFKEGDQWKPFEGNHPYYPYATSLMMEAEMQVDCSVISVARNEAEEETSVLLTNPVTDRAAVRLSSASKYLACELYDIRGERMAMVDVTADSDRLEFDVKAAPGLYVLRLLYDTHVESIKLVKR